MTDTPCHMDWTEGGLELHRDAQWADKEVLEHDAADSKGRWSTEEPGG